VTRTRRLARRNLSMVFQSYALFPHLDVADNILFGLSVRGVAKAEQQQRLTRTADLLGLGHLLAAVRASCRAASSSGWRSAGR
jgi:ABC-type sugar transport system ATPase subunit